MHRRQVERLATGTPRRPIGWPLLPAGLAVALLMGACSNGQDESTPTIPTPSTDDSGSEASAGGETGGGGEADTIAYESPGADDVDLLLQSTDGLVDPRPTPILNVEGTDGTELILSFEMESHHCYGVHARVDEGEIEVVLSIETGVLPDVDPTACRYGVYPYTTAITLAEPLGARTITTTVREPVAAPDRSGGPIEPAPEAGEDPTTPPGDASGGQDEQAATTVPPAGDPTAPSPIERGGPAIAIDDAAQLIGQRVEDGVEWAIANDVEWRVLSYDGEPVAEESSFDPTRLSLVVDRDLIVRFEWS